MKINKLKSKAQLERLEKIKQKRKDASWLNTECINFDDGLNQKLI